ncbi:MAG: hypothetical protein VW228_03335 [Pelagibacteraceae bacterium]
MSSFSDKKQKLDFTKTESYSKNNIDFFNLKTQRSSEEKSEKLQNFVFVGAVSIFVVAFIAFIYA